MTDKPRRPQTEPEVLIPSREAARRIGVTADTLSRWRSEETGPRYVRVARTKCFYRPSDIAAWLDGRSVG